MHVAQPKILGQDVGRNAGIARQRLSAMKQRIGGAFGRVFRRDERADEETRDGTQSEIRVLKIHDLRALQRQRLRGRRRRIAVGITFEFVGVFAVSPRVIPLLARNDRLPIVVLLDRLDGVLDEFRVGVGDFRAKGFDQSPKLVRRLVLRNDRDGRRWRRWRRRRRSDRNGGRRTRTAFTAFAGLLVDAD